MKTHTTTGAHGLSYRYWYDRSYRCWYAYPFGTEDRPEGLFQSQIGNAVHAYDREGILYEINTYDEWNLYEPLPVELPVAEVNTTTLLP